MNFAAAKEDRAFYAMNGWVEFEGLLKEDEVEALNQEIDKILCQRLNLSDRYLYRALPEELFSQGHDLWRESDVIRRLCCRRSSAKLASDLFGESQIRLGADQLFSGGWKPPFPSATLLERSSFQQVLGAVVFCLKGDNSQDKGKSPSPISPFPSAPGNAIFFPEESILNLSTELLSKDTRYLMIVYTPQKTLYIKRDQDPHNHALKNLGYVFGDHLDNERHPLILK